MATTLYFYDLETSGLHPRLDRIMQFAGQRTDVNLRPIGDPDNFLIKLAPDVLPSPDAVLVTGITPQKTLEDGITEAEFFKIFSHKIAAPGTVMAGFNNIRFDDEFMRFGLYRNFYDAYEWQWQDGRSKWDLLDVVRMTRALRPDGIKWPVASDGSASNRLELLSSVNGLDHVNAHDALSDVQACIAVAKLIKEKQPKLYDYLFNLRDKNKAAALVNSDQPFVYSSGRFSSQYEKTTVCQKLIADPQRQGVLVYNLRTNPAAYVKLSPAELAKRWQLRDPEQEQFPVKSLAFNRCPAIAPMSVLDEDSQKRLEIDIKKLQDHAKTLQQAEDFGDKIVAALELMRPTKQPDMLIDSQKVDEMLYDGFINDSDKTKMRVVRAAAENELADLNLDFGDERLTKLLPLYKARNYPKSLTSDEQAKWEEFRKLRLMGGGEQSRLTQFYKRLSELAGQERQAQDQQFILTELQLYAESIMPV